jgi:Stage II sporulation protein E (SpoIIE)
MPPTLQRFLLIGTKLIAAAAPAGRVDHEPCLGIPQHPSRVQRLPEAPNPKIGELPGRRQRPAALPRIPAAELAARYVPGQGKIGGDWYDVFTLPTGEHCAVVGDVAGSGLQAAVIMGRMRSTLRSYALETSDPADILGRLHRKMQYFEPGALATVACAVLDPVMATARISLAGHLPAVLASPGQGASRESPATC